MKPATKLKEIHLNTNEYKVNAKLKKGWVYLGLKTERRVDSEGSFEDEITYILGEPEQEE